jgi:hypothetical protein
VVQVEVVILMQVEVVVQEILLVHLLHQGNNGGTSNSTSAKPLDVAVAVGLVELVVMDF